MLIDTDGFIYKNALGDDITLNDFIYPFETGLDIELDNERSDTRPKMQDHGQWPTYQYHGGMTITAEGGIYGTDSPSYITARKALLAIVRFIPVALSPYQGQVQLKWEGETEYWLADVDKVLFNAPLVPNSPSRSTFQLIFHSPLPFFIGQDTDDKYYWS